MEHEAGQVHSCTGRDVRDDGWQAACSQSPGPQYFESTVKGDTLGLHFVEGYRKFPDRGDSGPTTLWGSHLPMSLEDKLT